MARRSRRNNSTKTPARARRGFTQTTRTPLHRPFPIHHSSIQWVEEPIYQRPRRQVKAFTKVNKPPSRLLPPNPYSPLFSAPSRVTPRVSLDPFICARRAIRREIMFALGRGGSKVSRPKFTSKSKVKC